MFALAICAANPGFAADTPSAFKSQHESAARALKSGDWDAAARIYREILDSGRDDSLAPNAQLGLARALEGAGRRDDAIGGFEALIALVDDLGAKGKLSGQQPRQAWHFAANRGIAGVLTKQQKFAEAAEFFQKAATVLDGKRHAIVWQARAKTDAAICLHQAGKTAEAVALLRATADSLRAPELAGVGTFVRANLASLHRQAGDSDRAKAVLAEVDGDSRLDERQRAAAAAVAEGRTFKPAPPTGKLRTRKAPGYFAVESEGRFEIRIALQPVGTHFFGDNRYGWITAWFNLEDDPFKMTNLAGLGYFPLIKPHHVGYVERVDGSWKRVNSNRKKELSKVLDVNLGLQKGATRAQRGEVTFEVLEDTAARVRTRTRHDAWPFEVHDYTFYPTGQIFVAGHFDLQTDDPLTVRLAGVSYYTVKNTQINWAETVKGASRMSGEGGHPYSTPFLLSRSNDIPSFQTAMPDDILTCTPIQRNTITFINNEFPFSWRRAPIKFSADFDAETADFDLQMRVFPRDLDSFEAAAAYVADYQSPAKLAVSGGTVVTDDPGDRNGDGYNEAEGCYVLKADRGDGLSVTLESGGLKRFQPAFKVVGWQGPVPSAVAVDGEATENWNAAKIAGSTLVMQLLDVIESPTFSIKLAPAS